MKKTTKIIILCILLILLVLTLNNTYATNTKITTQRDTDSVSKENLLEAYDEFTAKYSNDDIKKAVEENREDIKKDLGVSDSTIDFVTNMVTSLDRSEIRRIIVEDLDVDEIQRKLDNGYSMDEIIKDMQKEEGVKKLTTIVLKILIASAIIKRFLIITAILIIYKIVLRWIIFRKAGRNGWASIIPIYKEVTYLKVSKLSPWWIIVLILPVFGWLIYAIIKLVSRFTLAKAFKKGAGFGFGLWLLPIIFESILAFSKSIKYKAIND